MGWSIKKPLGSSNSFVNRAISKPIPTLVGTMTGMGLSGGALGAGFSDIKGNFESKMNEYNRQIAEQDSNAANTLSELERLAVDEESKRQLLGLKQRGQINAFADEQQGRAKDFRRSLAESLTNRGRETFNLMNPSILEDLNSRGLFTSQTARDAAQANALKEIELSNSAHLADFDRDTFNDISDIRGTGLSALLGGDQSALDAALELRKAGIQRKFDEATAAKEQSFAEMLARRQSRDQMIQGIIGSLSGLGAGFLAGR